MKITDSLENSATFAYDANGNREAATDAESNTTTFSYDAMGLISGVRDAESGIRCTASTFLDTLGPK
jgi:YD repeat-containing protein